MLLQVSIRELCNRLISDPDDGGLKEAINADNNSIISYSTPCSLLPTQIYKTSSQYKVMCSCECFISAKSTHLSLLSWCDQYFKKSNIKTKNLKTEGPMKNKIAYMKHIKIQ